MADEALEDGGSKVEVFIPEHRVAQKWLQDLINMSDDDPEKLRHTRKTSWCTDECPPGMIHDGVEDAQECQSKAMLGWRSSVDGKHLDE